MPNYIRPTTKLTAEQIKAMLERIVTKRATPKLTAPTGSMDPMAARAAIAQPPSVERNYGQLMDNLNPDRPVTRTLPIENAMQEYMGNPDRFKQLPVGPPAQHVFPTTPGSPEDIGRGIANERMVFKPVVPQGVRGAQSAIRNELLGGNQSVGPAEAFANMIKRKEQGVPKIPSNEIGDVLGLALRLEDLWKASGGGRSGLGSLWKQYWQGSNMRDKIKNPKDYFIVNAVRYHNNPETFAARAPREKSLLDKMKQSYREQMGVDLDTGVPVGGSPDGL